ncbi:YjbF family lipoprotein [Aliivibrio salmonicida]|uniref:Lipoprotein n=1 Tax=Aliivibrio salmonicida (strain LFI1238) TaxID=316275 RepID=B6EPH9_ALISL|nr:YjbF family lipoprotein [Aliivibrio salmonicida]AZL83737.1 YjbF family lipoprotein [Aliivibrio salmonicida]CAQ77959.1 putative lipoprotein [Aliivibrio salmonicida LFI1238]
MKNITLYLLTFGCFLLTGCSQKIQDVQSTFNEAVFGMSDVELSAEHINELPYASAFVKINDSHNIFMVLALAESNPTTGVTQLKWLSSDNVMIVTENGRIIKTLALPNYNLIALNSVALPKLSQQLTAPQQWQAVYDWMPDYRYHYQASIHALPGEKSTLTSLVWTKEVTAIQELVSFSALDLTFTNQYWLDNTGEVVKTRQFIGPNMATIEMTFLKPFRS